MRLQICRFLGLLQDTRIILEDILVGTHINLTEGSTPLRSTFQSLSWLFKAYSILRNLFRFRPWTQILYLGVQARQTYLSCLGRFPRAKTNRVVAQSPAQNERQANFITSFEICMPITCSQKSYPLRGCSGPTGQLLAKTCGVNRKQQTLLKPKYKYRKQYYDFYNVLDSSDFCGIGHVVPNGITIRKRAL